MDLFEYVGARIREKRQQYAEGKGVSQEALANGLNVAANTVSRWETGTYRPTIEDIEKLARFFHTSILEFFPNGEEDLKDEPTSALLRVAKHLTNSDIEELIRYAEFRRARYFYKKRSRAPRKVLTK